MLTDIHYGAADPRDDEQHSGLIWFAEQCMANGAPLESYIIHAESIGDRELATFFRRALAESRRVKPDEGGAGRRAEAAAIAGAASQRISATAAVACGQPEPGADRDDGLRQRRLGLDQRGELDQLVLVRADVVDGKSPPGASVRTSSGRYPG